LGSGRNSLIFKLWQLLHSDPSALPYAWFREGERLGCRLRRLAPQQRQRLENEPLADAPDVELRILAMPRVRPVLAEVLFPASMALPKAKEFLFRELQEITVQTRGRSFRWCESARSIGLHFCDTPPNAHAVTLENGVSECFAGDSSGLLCNTTQLEFDRAAGWERSAVANWIEQQLRIRDLGRTAWLPVAHRMAPALRRVVADLLGACAEGVIPHSAPGADITVEFIPIFCKSKNARDQRGPRRPEPTSTWPATGSGLEIDLAAPRSGERVAHELRAQLPACGFVNLAEARAVVRKLEQLVAKPREGNGAGDGPHIIVMALYAAQAELICLLLQQSHALSHHTSSIAVGVPAQFRHREADAVLVSLTRSHKHRAVAYGEGPVALAQAWTRARRLLIVVGDPGNLIRRCQWRGVVDHLDEAAADRECQLLHGLVRYLQGQGECQSTFRITEGNMA
jgi:hypothetical protein